LGTPPRSSRRSVELSLSRLSLVIVTHDHRDAVRQALPAVSGQLREGDELIVVDNGSSDGTPGAVHELAPQARLIDAGTNLGFGAACNRGAAAASGDLLVFLNPDAVPAAGFREAIERPLVERRSWSAWQGLVTAQGGRIVNSRGGAVHFTGISWAGGAGEDVAAQRAIGEPGFVSGACLAITRAGFEQAGGFAEGFFLYHEDVDLSLRLRLAGGKLGVESQARVDHDYEFAKGAAKWRHLERNRWATLVRTYPGGLLLLLTPALIATEIALVPVSIAGGWFGQKARAWGDSLRGGPRLWRERRAIQRRSAIGAAQFARALSAELDSPYLGGARRSHVLRLALSAYWSVVLKLLGGSSSANDA
jgi:GT2 family glycosyltransferase